MHNMLNKLLDAKIRVRLSWRHRWLKKEITSYEYSTKVTRLDRAFDLRENAIRAVQW